MIKLNIQRFSSTNKTTHYELSQYVSSDLPTYLVDYNSDMSKIDAGINTAQTTADTASTAATNAATAASNAQTTADTAITNAATAKTAADTANDNIGTLANLTTTEKTTIVGAINEVDGDVGNLSQLPTTNKNSIVSSMNELYNIIEGDILYDNPTGTTSTISNLAHSISDYKYIEVSYRTNDGVEYETSIRGEVETTMLLQLTYIRFFGGFYIKHAEVQLSGTTLSFINNLQTRDFATTTNGDFIYVTKVIGYK